MFYSNHTLLGNILPLHTRNKTTSSWKTVGTRKPTIKKKMFSLFLIFLTNLSLSLSLNPDILGEQQQQQPVYNHTCDNGDFWEGWKMHTRHCRQVWPVGECICFSNCQVTYNHYPGVCIEYNSTSSSSKTTTTTTISPGPSTTARPNPVKKNAAGVIICAILVVMIMGCAFFCLFDAWKRGLYTPLPRPQFPTNQRLADRDGFTDIDLGPE